MSVCVNLSYGSWRCGSPRSRWVSVLLLTPVVICNVLDTTSGRIVIVIALKISYLFVLSNLIKSKTIELTLTGAMYVKPSNCSLIASLTDCLR